MAQTVIRYNVHLPLGSGGSRVGSYKTLEEARAFASSSDRKDLQIWKTLYCKGSSDKLYPQGSWCVS